MKNTFLSAALVAMALSACGGNGAGADSGAKQQVWLEDGLFRPSVTSVSPLTATTGVLTTFTVNGNLLNRNMLFTVANCNGLKELDGGTDNARQFTCTPSGAPGARAGRVAENASTAAILFVFEVNVQ